MAVRHSWRLLVKIFTKMILAVMVLAAIPSFANTLTFPNDICSGSSDGSGPFIACGNGSYINQVYGDTAQVDVVYNDVINGDSLRWWDTGYNELIGVAWGGNGDCPGCSFDAIILLPAPGYQITLNGFDLGAWPSSVLNTNLFVKDFYTGNILNYGLQTIGTGNQSVHFAPSLTSKGAISINWYDTGYNVGIDNIDFTISQSGVPEPATLTLLGAGAAALAARLRKFRG